ncbi:MAG TPA: putative Ig domain-containing protein [Steroidobacteraceae bacterium]|nr:putative Ig domain-containing protein [Steroidobacteraceae bacterium]
MAFVGLGVFALKSGTVHPDVQAPAAVVATNPSGVSGNRAPKLDALASATTRTGTSYQLVPKALDPDGDTLSFSAVNLPSWARIDQATGVISGTPGVSDIGENEAITVTVADATHRTTSAPFSITVVGPPAAVVRWQKPASRVDGSVLDDLAGYRIVYGRDPENMDHSIFIADPDQLSYDFNTLDKGAWYFAVIAITANGLEGPATPPAMKKI